MCLSYTFRTRSLILFYNISVTSLVLCYNISLALNLPGEPFLEGDGFISSKLSHSAISKKINLHRTISLLVGRSGQVHILVLYLVCPILVLSICPTTNYRIQDIMCRFLNCQLSKIVH